MTRVQVTEPRLPGLVAAMVAGLIALAGSGFLVGSLLMGGQSPAVLAVGGAFVLAIGAVAVAGAWRMLAPRVYFEAGAHGIVPVQALGALVGPDAPAAPVAWHEVAALDLHRAPGARRGPLGGDVGVVVRCELRDGRVVYLPAFGEPGGEALLETLRDHWAAATPGRQPASSPQQ